MTDIFSMTNSTKCIELDGKKYILRIPGKGTDKLINRHQEYKVYNAIKNYHISDDVLYFDENSGVKIAKFIDNARNCDSKNINDVEEGMKIIHKLHSLNISVDFDFNLKEKINFYESLMKSTKFSYGEIKKKIFSLLDIVEKMDVKTCLCHIDPNQDNILIDRDSGKVKALVDWEYAAMQDPVIDVAMFAIYAMYSKDEIDRLFSIYSKFAKVDETAKLRYYIYIAACGLLWSNWCEYKNELGQTFGGIYEKSQYEYAVNYSALVEDLIK